MHDGHVYVPTNLWVPATVGTDGSVLPTPVVNDMGAGKTVEKWDAWTAEQREKHRNGNGHGKSLSIEVQRLLPTPTARDYKDTGKNTNYQRQADRKLLAGVIMVQRSNDGDTSSGG